MNPFAPIRKLCRVLAVFVLGGLVAACGGGGGGGEQSNPISLATAWAGPYSSADESYLAMAVQDGNALEFRAVRYESATSAFIYSGPLILGNDGVATVSSLKAMRANGSLRTGLASFTGVSATAHSAIYTLNDDSDAPELSPVMSGVRRQPSDDLAGSWRGTWVDGLIGSNSDITLAGIGSNATVVVQALGCSGISMAFGSYLTGPGVYRAVLTYPETTECLGRKGKSLTGWALVRATGSGQRLDLVAIDAQGSGVVFRASR